jgi:hypothetical protein
VINVEYTSNIGVTFNICTKFLYVFEHKISHIVYFVGALTGKILSNFDNNRVKMYLLPITRIKLDSMTSLFTPQIQSS